MYIPSSFRVDDPVKLTEFIRQYSFATLITLDKGMPFASHIPMLLKPVEGGENKLVSHMARANPQWQHFASGQEVLCIFHGPHTYISPTWYQTAPAVPTWNYAAVHVYGGANVVTEQSQISEILNDTVAKYEQEPDWLAKLANDYRDGMIKGIVAFEITINRIEGKFKLSQNRSEEDRSRVHQTLLESTNPDDQAVAKIMAENGTTSV